MNWPQIAPHFECDGALLDIYIHNTSIDDWSCVWNFLLINRSRLLFIIDSEMITPPLTVGEAFNLRRAHATTASYFLGKQRFNCHFFTEQEVEFDLDPRDVTGPADAEQLVGFIRDIGRITGKSVSLTHEGAPFAIIARFDPTSESLIWSPNLSIGENL